MISRRMISPRMDTYRMDIRLPSPSRRLLALFCVLLFGCAAAGRHNLPATTQSTTQSSLTPHTIDFAKSAVPIDRFRADDHEIDLRNRISFTHHGDIYFGQSDTVDENDEVDSTIPLIVRSVKGGWGAISLENVALKNGEWQFVASGPGEHEIWGILDDTLTHTAKAITLAHSTDAGATWTLSTVAKPFNTGDYDSFSMDKTGHGRLTVYVPPAKKHPNRAGFYHFRTADDGKTWSAAEHEPDALDPADEIPADEDPEPLQSAPTQNASAENAAAQPPSLNRTGT